MTTYAFSLPGVVRPDVFVAAPSLFHAQRMLELAGLIGYRFRDIVP